MNSSIIRYIQGKVLMIEGALLLLPCLIALIYKEKTGLYFLLVAAISALTGYLASRNKPENPVFYLKEGCLITVGSWFLMSLF